MLERPDLASSIDTGIVRRDELLCSADYLDVKRYPHITFTARRMVADPDGRLRVVGALTIRSVTRTRTLLGGDGHRPA
jgi:polyisoprenoid-binding protein YceI